MMTIEEALKALDSIKVTLVSFRMMEKEYTGMVSDLMFVDIIGHVTEQEAEKIILKRMVETDSDYTSIEIKKICHANSVLAGKNDGLIPLLDGLDG